MNNLRPLQIEPTVKTPKINFDPEKGVLLMSGRSMPENVLDLNLYWIGLKNTVSIRQIQPPLL
jgi:hypothetical protein